jgi:hypothetical protein
LNHFYIENPGKLVADFATNANPVEADFSSLGLPVSDYNAMNEITQTNFSMKVVVPNVECDHCVVRLRYISQNPTENDRGMTFYQCADVKVVKSAVAITSEVSKPVKTVVKAETATNGTACCAPHQFTLEGYETASWRNPTAKKYYFDTPSKMFRIDTNSGSGTGTKDGYFQMISNFTSGIEYYYNVNANTCDLYGLNYWSDWCYGEINKQSWLQSVVVGTQVADVWAQEGSPFTWTNTRHSCVPVSQNRVDTGEATYYYNMNVGAPDVSVFALPEACKRAEQTVDLKSLKTSPAHHRL